MRADGLSLLVLLLLAAAARSAPIPDHLVQRYKVRCGVDATKTTNYVLTGMPKTGTTYLHMNVARALKQLGFDNRSDQTPGKPHDTCSLSGKDAVFFYHFYSWQVAKKIELVDWAKKVVYIVRDEAQTFQSGYNYFRDKVDIMDMFRNNSPLLLSRIIGGNRRLRQHVSEHRRDLGDTTLLVHFDQLTSHCEAVIANVVLFLLGRELPPDFRCFDDGPNNQLKITKADRHMHYVDRTGQLLAMYRGSRVDWSEIFEFQALHTFHLDPRYKMAGIPKLRNIASGIF